ncbi:MAG: class II aldolase/adducin family protein [Bacteroidaceae bacterium]|nr:class II aldolase/adducin family protein [Bacteroidaceae bacterium]
MQQQIQAFLAAAHKVGAMGLTRCSSGNLSWRVGDVALVSATGSWVPELREDQVAVCDIATGKSLNGVRPSMESGFHLTVLRERRDINVVLHCQSIAATTVACMDPRPTDFNVTAELPCHCGKEIAVVPYLRPGSPLLAEAVVEALRTHDSVLLLKHGQVFVGRDFNAAIEKAAFLEMACDIILRAQGRHTLLTPAEIADIEHTFLGK